MFRFQGSRRRARSSSLLPLEEIKAAIVLVLEDIGGEAKCVEVVRRVGALLSDDWTDADRAWAPKGLGPRWESRVRSAGRMLGLRGVLDWSAPRGVWRLAA